MVSLRYELVFLRNYENEELQDNDQEQENKKISYRYA